MLHRLLENTSVSENRQTGDNSPIVRFIHCKNPDNNNFTAVRQFKILVLGPSITFHVRLPVACRDQRIGWYSEHAADGISSPVNLRVFHRLGLPLGRFGITSLTTADRGLIL